MAGNTDIVLETRGLYKAFPGTIATNNVSFDVHRQEVHAIIGENGAGKSTLCKLLTGLYQPDRGDIIFMGNKVSYRTTTEAMAAGINMVYQERNLIPHLTGAQNIMLGNEITKMGVILDEKEIRATAYKIRDELGIDIPLDMPVGHLSAGVQQSIEIVRAFSTNPKLLILDEPTSGLDPIIRDEILDIFMDFIQEETRSIFVSTHIVEDLEKIADYITFIHKGRILISEEKDHLLERFVILKGPRESFALFAPSELIGYKENRFGAEAMTEADTWRKKRKNAEGLTVEPVRIQDIMLYYVKGERL